MNHIRNALIWLALGIAAGFAAFYTPAAHAEDVHVCTGIYQNAQAVYAEVDAAPEGADLTPLAVRIQAELNPGQASVLIAGLQFLLQNWGHPDLSRTSFAEAAAALCQAEFGQIADRNNT